jgi:aminoacyl tRNA synthase complex-interacting multifunctional protein 1
MTVGTISSHRTTSDAFLATLTVPQSILLQDRLVALLAGLAPSLQLTTVVQQTKSITSTSGELVLYNGTTSHQRNSILRTLCSFFVQLDCMPYTLLAGSSSYGNRSKDIHRANMSEISSWMSLISTTTICNEKNLDTFLSNVNQHLATHAFLVTASSSPTLADLDLYFTLTSTSTMSTVDIYPHIVRWMNTVHPTVSQWMEEVRQKKDVPWIQQNLQAFELPKNSFIGPSYPSTLPTFYFDEEEEDAVTNLPATPDNQVSTVSTSAGTAASSSAVLLPSATEVPAAVAKLDAVGVGEGLTEEQKKEVAEKRAKRAAEKKAAAAAKKVDQPAAASAKEGYDISALDIRVGKITRVWNHESADKLYCEEIDLGTEKRQIASGLRPFYKLEEMDQQSVLVLCNLKPRSLVGFTSHGMVLCASNDDKSKVEFVRAPDGAALGERVIFDGYGGKEPEVESKVAKKKIFEKVSPHLMTDAEGKVVWKGGAKATTTAGECFAVNFMPHGHVS